MSQEIPRYIPFTVTLVNGVGVFEFDGGGTLDSGWFSPSDQNALYDYKIVDINSGAGRWANQRLRGDRLDPINRTFQGRTRLTITSSANQTMTIAGTIAILSIL